MPRKLRVEYAGAIYHVLNRGDRREAIFLDRADREMFLATLAGVCRKTGWQVHAYCLMGNHFHMVVETPRPNLVAGMRWFLGTGPAALRGRIAGVRGAEGRTAVGPDVGSAGLDGAGIAAAPEGQPAESAIGRPAAFGNDDDLAVDCETLVDGALADSRQCRPCDPTA